MDWSRRFRRFARPGAGVALAIVGIPGLLDDLADWGRWLGMLSPAWSGFATGVGVTLITFGLLAEVENWRKRRQHSSESVLVDYATACSITNRYIDPDQTMRSGIIIAIRSQILAKFELVVGAKHGDLYDGALLHRWLQKNAARALVNHQDEIV